MSSSSSKKLHLHLEALVKQEYLFVQIVLIDSRHYWHAQRTLKISRLGCHSNKKSRYRTYVQTGLIGWGNNKNVKESFYEEHDWQNNWVEYEFDGESIKV